MGTDTTPAPHSGEGEYPIINPFFRAAAEAHAAAYAEHFADRLIAVYVWGSVHRDEAVVGISDLDLHAIIDGPVMPADREGLSHRRPQLAAAFPGANGLSWPMSYDRLVAGVSADATPSQRRVTQAMAFRLEADATLLHGRDLLPDLAGAAPVDHDFGHGSFESQRDLALWAAGRLSENEADFSLPTAPHLRLRKLARLGVLAGTWYLIATGQLRSLRGLDALPALQQEFPIWNPFSEQTEQFYIHPLPETDAAREIDAYTRELARWTEMLAEQLGMKPPTTIAA